MRKPATRTVRLAALARAERRTRARRRGGAQHGGRGEPGLPKREFPIAPQADVVELPQKRTWWRRVFRRAA